MSVDLAVVMSGSLVELAALVSVEVCGGLVVESVSVGVVVSV